MEVPQQYVILVDENDKARGQMEKIQAHAEGELHRAFSVFIFNSKGKLLIQRRATEKYHAGGLWTNTCCSHPKPGEATIEGATRRLNEEMGISTDLQNKFSFIYRHEFDNGMTEHEFDHVYFGWTDDLPVINPDEVSEYKYISMNQLKEELESSPETFTPWLHVCFERVFHAWNQERSNHKAV